MSSSYDRRRDSLKGIYLTVIAASILVVGCNSQELRPAPATYKVLGRVLTSEGRPAAKAIIVFRPVDGNLEMKATGMTDSQGAFSLSVLYPDRKIEGAQEGAHQAYLLKPLEQQERGGEKIPLSGEFVVAPKDNHFEIKLPKGAW